MEIQSKEQKRWPCYTYLLSEPASYSQAYSQSQRVPGGGERCRMNHQEGFPEEGGPGRKNRAGIIGDGYSRGSLIGIKIWRWEPDQYGCGTVKKHTTESNEQVHQYKDVR